MKFSDDSDVSVVLTSCGRFDLLARTLESFDRFNTYPIKAVLITEDSGDDRVREFIPSHWRNLTTVFVNKPKLGQLASIDLAYAAVTTPYIFHLEDDWEFYRSGFIEDSMTLLREQPRLLQVWLRSYAHDIRLFAPFNSLGEREMLEGVRYARVLSTRPSWKGFSLNPGLRRLEDYLKLAPFRQHAGEEQISLRYAELGFHAVMLEADAVLHTGWDAHITARPDAIKQQRRRRRQRSIAAAAVIIAFVMGASIF